MTNKSPLFFTFIVPWLLAIAVPSVSAQTAPNLRLHAYGELSIEHDKHQPLLLSLLLSNDAAANARLENYTSKLVHQAHAETSNSMTESQKKHLDEFFPTTEAKDIVLGSERQSPAELLSIQVFGENESRPLTVKVRPIAKSAPKPGLVRLDADNSLELLYGIDASTLQQLPPGNYAITATINSTGGGGSWRGSAKSNSVAVKLVDALAERDKQLSQYQYGRFHLLDANYDETEKCAQLLLRENPNSINGMELHAEAAAGRGNLTEAKIAFQKAIDLYESKWTKAKLPPGHIVEPPEYLLNSLQQVTQLIESDRSRK